MNEGVNELYRAALNSLKAELTSGSRRVRRPGVHNGLTLDRVESALQRLDGGRFGYCRRCSLLIPHAELLRYPYEERCPVCRETRDRPRPVAYPQPIRQA